MSRNHQGKQSATQSKPTESTDLIPLLPEEIKAFTQRAAKGQLLSFFWRDRGQDGTTKGKIEGVGATADTLGVRFSPGFRRELPRRWLSYDGGMYRCIDDTNHKC